MKGNSAEESYELEKNSKVKASKEAKLEKLKSSKTRKTTHEF